MADAVRLHDLRLSRSARRPRPDAASSPEPRGSGRSSPRRCPTWVRGVRRRAAPGVLTPQSVTSDCACATPLVTIRAISRGRPW